MCPPRLVKGTSPHAVLRQFTRRMSRSTRSRLAARIRRPLAIVAVVASSFALVVSAPEAQAVASVSGIYGWGSNGQGTLGDGTNTSTTVPVATLMTGALAGETIVQVTVGSGSTSCALTATGRVACWGMGLNGELGNGSALSSNVPVNIYTSGVLAGKRIVQVEAYASVVCVLTSDGLVYCWGVNSFGTLGDGSDNTLGEGISSRVPVAVRTSGALVGRTVTRLSTGGFATVCAILDNGSAACWGSGLYGSMGNGTNNISNLSPVAVSMTGVLAGKRFSQISGSNFSMHGLLTDGSMVAWGRNNSGQLGNGLLLDANTAVAVDTTGALNGRTIRSVTAAAEMACALDSAGLAYCWGDNALGVFGNGTTTNSRTGVEAMRTGSLAGQPLQALSSNNENTCAVTIANAISCTGQGSYGVLGNGANGNTTSPVEVVASGVLEGKSILGISVGGYQALAWGAADVYDSEAPADHMQQVGVPSTGSCTDVDREDLNWSGVASGGWGRSWAQWANDGAGGDICVRTLYYRSGLGRWGIRA